jgi:hypothetical protein
MYRIDNETATTSLPTPAVPGPNPDGFFTKGVPGSVPATIVEQDWANAVQEELCYVIETMGLTLDKAVHTQLLAAIRLVGQAGDGSYAASTSAANTYTATLSPAPTAYTTGMTVFIKFTNANSGASTLNLNGLGAKSIRDGSGAVLINGNIQAGMVGAFVYDGTNFQIMNPYTGSTAATPVGVQTSLYSSAVDSGSANTYVATLSPVPTYTTGLRCTIKITNTNTGASSLNLNSLGAANIKTTSGNDPKAGMLLAGMEAEFFYDGTNFQLLNPNVTTSVQNSLFSSATDGGAANAYTATLSPALTAYVAGMRCIIKITNTNTGASTINLNALGTKNIKTLNGADPSAGMLYAGMEADLFYDGTNFQLMNAFNAVTQQNSIYTAAADSGSANAYAATMTPAVTAYASGQKFIVKITNTNTGASTLNINGLGVKNIKTLAGADPIAGMIFAGMEAIFVYDGTNMQLINAFNGTTFQNGTYIYFADSGAADAYVITATPAPAAYVTGMRFFVLIANSNTGASTINVNSLGVKSIKDRNGTTLTANDLKAGQVAELVYDGTNFQVVNFTAGAGSSAVFVNRVGGSVTGTVSTTGSALAADNTIPQSSEGVQICTQAITPANSSNKLSISFLGQIQNAGGTFPIIATIALFQDSTANALAAEAKHIDVTQKMGQLSLKHTMTAGTTSSTTFKIRVGLSDGTSTVYCNLSGTGAAVFGGVCTSHFEIQETTV